jgi:hypothetical protein
MVYTEIKTQNKNKYYYRALSIRVGNKYKKKRIYLGKNLDPKMLSSLEKKADKKLKIPNQNIERLKQKIVPILKKNNIKRAGIFGSYAEGSPKKGSDIDILVLPSKDIGFAFAGIEDELSKKLGIKVDLVSYNALSPYLKDKILSQEIRII